MTIQSSYQDRTDKLQRSNNRIALTVCFVVACMVGLSFAAVPLYKIFCQVTGLDGTTQRASKASEVIVDQSVRVRFDANVSSDLPWDFKPVHRKVDIKLGENKVIYYSATNMSDQTIIGTARFNVVPEIAGSYFNKVQCFCFTEQKLKPGETIKMPVDFFVDPEMIKDADAKGVREITLSYTFFPVNTKVSQLKEKTASKALRAADLSKF